ncbi:MAG: NAD(P)-dependent glycerol-3-phosphate dehydrogenase [PS1 clade bacterium]|uniref:Glycerol-3-phosphate dehydrogenase [NAD(P)+] n=1 Tax=PS1 clade bacterium TaxID=2175152 RepID=A0A937HBU7_9PROT|nr:NAD(P)-dependent glycerol-3-phosphate dehydrogenase [PS1 clade bacterium]
MSHINQFAAVAEPSIAVLGAGAWGTALACVLAHKHAEIMLWANEAETVAAVNQRHENTPFLAGVPLPETIKATAALEDLADADIILMVVPAQFARPVLAALAALNDKAMLVLCAKGIERDSLQLMSDVARAHFAPQRLAVLSGPSFAADVARGLPTAVTLACADVETGAWLATHIGTAHFRTYLSDDITGAEIGGAIKNVLAIACGIVAGKGLGESARAALTARGFVEMSRLGAALGAKPETLSGLSGLGDLILTCASDTSRNFSLGRALGEGDKAETVLGARNSVSEGAMSAAAVAALADKHGVDMPICRAVNSILSGDAGVDEAINDLLARPVARENDEMIKGA